MTATPRAEGGKEPALGKQGDTGLAKNSLRFSHKLLQKTPDEPFSQYLANVLGTVLGIACALFITVSPVGLGSGHIVGVL